MQTVAMYGNLTSILYIGLCPHGAGQRRTRLNTWIRTISNVLFGHFDRGKWIKRTKNLYFSIKKDVFFPS